MEIEEVLLPMMASGLSIGQSEARILRLTSSFSVAVSITRSQSPNASIVSAGWMRCSAALRSSSLIRLLETCRAMLPLMVAMPALIRSGATSLSMTEKPASADTCAMPLPIWPAPMMPTLRMLSFMAAGSGDWRSTTSSFGMELLVGGPPFLRRSARPDHGCRHAIICRLCRVPRPVPAGPDTDPRPVRNRRPGRSGPPRPC